MRRTALTMMLAWFGTCGCAGRMNTDLLQARIREQATQLSETQREVAKTRSELKQAKLEAERLKTELAQASHSEDRVSSVPPQIQRLKVNGLATGGINKDEYPGDDAVVVQFVPLDRDKEPVRQSGEIEFVLIDPKLAESDRELGRWSFTAEDCQNRWTRGITSSGFQFTLPLKFPPEHSDLIVQLQFTTSDSKRLRVNHPVKLVVASGQGTVQNIRSRKKPVQVVEELDEPLPPVGDGDSNLVDDDFPDWAEEDRKAGFSNSGHTELHSSNWTDATIPRLR